MCSRWPMTGRAKRWRTTLVCAWELTLPAARSHIRRWPRASACPSRRWSKRGRQPLPDYLSGLSAAPRILILSAAIGEGHDLPARVIRDGIAAARPDATVAIVDAVAEAGGIIQKL